VLDDPLRNQGCTLTASAMGSLSRALLGRENKNKMKCTSTVEIYRRRGTVLYVSFPCPCSTRQTATWQTTRP
jgi:hypothetical protein